MLKVAMLFLSVFSLLIATNAFAQEAKCVSGYGKSACGYDCVVAYGDVACARTPFGACIAAYGIVYCWDPSYFAGRKAECLAAYGDVACGYDCTSGYGEVKCSSNPYGTCTAAYGHVVCSE